MSSAKILLGLAAVGFLLTKKKSTRTSTYGDYTPASAQDEGVRTVSRPAPSANVEILQRNLNTFYRNVQTATNLKAFNGGPILAGEPLAPRSAARSPDATTPDGVTYYGSSTTCPTTGPLDVDGKFGRCTARAYWIAWAAVSLAQPPGGTPTLKQFEPTLADVAAIPSTDISFWSAISRGVAQTHRELAAGGLTG